MTISIFQAKPLRRHVACSLAPVSLVSAVALDSRRRTRRVGGFTLVELLVATTVTLLLVVVLVQVFNGASNAWRHSETQVDAYREARGALQLMARDLSATLQASYAQAGGGADPASVTTNGPAMPTLVLEHYSKYETVQTPGTSPINEEVYCLTNIHNGGASSLCAVGYFCQWMPYIPGGPVGQSPKAFALMRQSLNSDGTFLRMKAAANNPRLTFLDLYRRDLTGAGSVLTPPVAEVTQVAAYIWDLRFRIDTDLNDSANNPNGAVADGNNPAPKDHSSTLRFYGGDAASQPYPPRLPPYVEIRFKALSNIAGRRLEGITNVDDASMWSDTNNTLYKQIIQPNFQQFVLRVPLINATPL